MASRRRRLPAVYNTILAEHRARLAEVSEGAGLGRLRSLYNRAQTELEEKLRRLTQANRDTTFTAVQARALLAQVRQGIAAIAQMLAGGTADLSEQASFAALRGLERDISRLDVAFGMSVTALPIAEAARFAKVHRRHRHSLLEQHRKSVRAWGTQTINDIRESMALSLATGATTDEAIDKIAEVADTEWWKASRIVRTETAWSFSASATAGIDDAREVLPDIRSRWVELCAEDGTPLDDRVAVDSIAMHGQLSVDGLFTMPPVAPVPDARGNILVPDALVGGTWPHPPDRPNDRAVVQPWRPGWWIPAWEWRGRRVWL